MLATAFFSVDSYLRDRPFTTLFVTLVLGLFMSAHFVWCALRPGQNGQRAVVALVLMMSVSSFVMAGPRICSQMASDGWLPHWLAPQEGPPRHAILAQALRHIGTDIACANEQHTGAGRLGGHAVPGCASPTGLIRS